MNFPEKLYHSSNISVIRFTHQICIINKYDLVSWKKYNTLSITSALALARGWDESELSLWIYVSEYILTECFQLLKYRYENTLTFPLNFSLIQLHYKHFIKIKENFVVLFLSHKSNSFLSPFSFNSYINRISNLII